jgi:hypothetical protein
MGTRTGASDSVHHFHARPLERLAVATKTRIRQVQGAHKRLTVNHKERLIAIKSDNGVGERSINKEVAATYTTSYCKTQEDRETQQ